MVEPCFHTLLWEETICNERWHDRWRGYAPLVEEWPWVADWIPILEDVLDSPAAVDVGRGVDETVAFGQRPVQESIVDRSTG